MSHAFGTWISRSHIQSDRRIPDVRRSEYKCLIPTRRASRLLCFLGSSLLSEYSLTTCVMAILSGLAVMLEHGPSNTTLLYSVLGVVGGITGLLFATLVWPNAFSPVSRVVSWVPNVRLVSLPLFGSYLLPEGISAMEVSHQARGNWSSYSRTGVYLA